MFENFQKIIQNFCDFRNWFWSWPKRKGLFRLFMMIFDFSIYHRFFSVTWFLQKKLIYKNKFFCSFCFFLYNSINIHSRIIDHFRVLSKQLFQFFYKIFFLTPKFSYSGLLIFFLFLWVSELGRDLGSWDPFFIFGKQK